MITDSIREALDHPVLPDIEQRRLVALAAAGDADARALVIRYNQRLIFSIAYKRVYLAGPHTLEDLMDEGVKGLLKAIQAFDPAYSNRFATYATWHIRKEIYEFCYRNGPTANLTGRQARKLSKAAFVRAQLYQAGREPNAAEIAEELGMTEDGYKELVRAASPVRIDNRQECDENESVPEILIATDVTEASAMDSLMVQQALEVISDEPEVVKAALMGHMGFGCGKPKTYDQIAEEQGITRAEARRSVNRAMKKIRKAWGVEKAPKRR